jgi:hypothetical protein
MIRKNPEKRDIIDMFRKARCPSLWMFSVLSFLPSFFPHLCCFFKSFFYSAHAFHSSAVTVKNSQFPKRQLKKAAMLAAPPSWRVSPYRDVL